MFSRYGNPKMCKPEYREFAVAFKRDCATAFLSSYITLLAVLPAGGYLPDRVVNLAGASTPHEHPLNTPPIPPQHHSNTPSISPQHPSNTPSTPLQYPLYNPQHPSNTPSTPLQYPLNTPSTPLQYLPMTLPHGAAVPDHGAGAGQHVQAPQAAARRNGRAVQVDPIKPTLKPPGTKRLKLLFGEPP